MPEQPGFITLEGIEGSGKSTQIPLLVRALAASGRKVETTREPGGTPRAEAIRDLLLSDAFTGAAPETELLLFLAARHDHIENRINPALHAGRWVVCDRFTEATIAYQGFGRGLDPDRVRRLTGAAETVAPDLVLLLDMPVAEAFPRIAARGAENHLDREDASFHQRVRDGYLQLAAESPERITMIDATGSVEVVHGRIVDAVRAHFGIALVPQELEKAAP